jgi:hypothetical protein
MESSVDHARPNKKNIDAFGAIINFVNDLWEVFGKGATVTPLALYHRLVGKINMSDREGIQKVIVGFSDFLKKYDHCLVNTSGESIPKGVIISYGTSERIHLEIQKYLHQSDQATKESIRRHLLTISAILEPNKEKIAQLEKKISDLNIDTDTKEGQFISNIMQKAKDNMADVNTDDPMQAMTSIFRSGIIQDMVTGLQQGVGNGEMNIQTLLTTMQSALGAIMPMPSQLQVEEVKEQKEDVD